MITNDNDLDEINSEDLLYNKLTYNYKPKSKQKSSSNRGKRNTNSQGNTNTKNNSNKNTKTKNKNSNNIQNSSSQNKKGSKSPNRNESKSPTKNNNKNKKNTSIIKPFEISIPDNDDSDYQKIKITINACAFIDEYMMPIWCNKNNYIKFIVEGKWKIGKLYEFTDSKGMPSNQSSGFNFGALIGRVGLEQKKSITFVVGNDSCIFIKEEGPFFLRRHLPKKIEN